MAERKPGKPGKPGRAFGIIAAIGVQALFVAGLMIALRVVDVGPTIVDLIGGPLPPAQQPPEEPPDVNVPPQQPTVDNVPPPEVPDVRPCEDCGNAPNRPENANTRYPMPAFGQALPEYPPGEKRLGHEGMVVVKICVDERGHATSASLATSSGYPMLDRAAIEWAERIRWRPGTINGHPEAMCFNQPYRFRLDG